jgi:hypothetical protein
MTKDQQLDRFRDAVQRKMAESDAAAREERPVTGAPPEAEGGDTQRSLTEQGRTQDVFSVRDKNSQKGKKTADKWNQ